VITLNCKSVIDNSISSRLVAIIKKETGCNPLSDIDYRGGKNVHARQLYFTFMVRNTTMTYKAIGEMLNKDHATVWHSIRSINNLYETDKRFRDVYDRINTKLNSN
jgi:hypothetical protein